MLRSSALSLDRQAIIIAFDLPLNLIFHLQDLKFMYSREFSLENVRIMFPFGLYQKYFQDC